MDGSTLLRDLRGILQEDSSSAFLEDRVSYEFLYQAVCEFVHRSRSVTATQSITTVADQAAYDLNPDFLEMAHTDSEGRKFIKYYNGSGYSFLYAKDYGQVVYDNNTSSVPIPYNWAIKDDQTATTNLTGTVSAAGAISASTGEATLTDTVLSQFTDVTVGDAVHNTTDGSSGYVVATSSTSAIITAQFDGTENDWDGADAYVITLQNRLQLVLDPPPDTAGHTVTVYYIQRPGPVFSKFRAYRINPRYRSVIVKYAAWLYKYRDMTPDFGDKWYQIFDAEARKASQEFNRAQDRTGFKAFFKKR
jgi:hypothetical protein